MVVVCRVSKQAIFVPCLTTDTAVELAKHFIKHVFSKHGLPEDIVSDRGTLFVSKFWRAVCKMLDVQQSFSTAYHPQTDGQTERTNQTLEQYLCTFVNYDQNDWEEWLPLAEFVYNNMPSDATGVSPFFANKGYHPRLTMSLKDVPSHAAHLKVAEMKKVNEYLKKELGKTNVGYAEQINHKRRPIPEDKFQIGELVWLDLRNVETKRPTKKLDYKHFGPFRITEKISTHAYRLDLPQTMKGIHNVFHINLLTPNPTEYYPQRKPPPAPPIEIENQEENYEVEKILDSHRKRGKLFYLVKWKGYGPEHDTWEPIINMLNAKETVKKFHIQYPKKAGLEEGEWERETK
jgi:hypothetical protein